MASITIDQVKQIASLESDVARTQLKQFLQWEDFDEETNFQQSIYLDYLYDSLHFTIHKGFPWEHVCRMFKLTTDFLEESKGMSLPETINLYREKCHECQDEVSDNYLKVYSDYMFSTYLQHFKLYQRVFTKDQDCRTIDVNVSVEVPPQPPAFKDGKDVNIWEYEKKLEDIEEKGKERKKEREDTSMTKKREDEEYINKVYEEVDNSEGPLQKEHLMLLITEVARSHLTAATHHLQANIDNTLDDLDVMLEKTILPRPAELGPPQRYRTKTPVAANMNTTTTPRKKSAKERKGSSRASKAKS